MTVNIDKIKKNIYHSLEYDKYINITETLHLFL